MKQGKLILAFFVALSTQALGGTYTIYSTYIPEPSSADGTTNGDTSASSTNSIHLDANVYVPDGVVAPAPAVVLVHGFGETKSTATIVTLGRILPPLATSWSHPPCAASAIPTAWSRWSDPTRSTT